MHGIRQVKNAIETREGTLFVTEQNPTEWIRRATQGDLRDCKILVPSDLEDLAEHGKKDCWLLMEQPFLSLTLAEFYNAAMEWADMDDRPVVIILVSDLAQPIKTRLSECQGVIFL